MFFFSAKYFCLQKTLNSKTECAYLLFLYACKNVINKIAKYFWSLNSNHPKNVNKADNFFFIFKWHFLPSQFFALFSWNLFIKRVNHSENLFKKFPVFVSSSAKLYKRWMPKGLRYILREYQHFLTSFFFTGIKWFSPALSLFILEHHFLIMLLLPKWCY